jgi:hypothetical protein
MLELIHSTWISRFIQWLRPKGLSTLAWQRARRALRSQPGRRSIKVKLWDEV